MRSSIALVLLVVSVPTLSAGGRPAGPEAPVPDVFRMEELADGVWAALVVDRPPAYAFANSLVVLDDEGVLVVDTQQSPTAARDLIGWIRSRTGAPVRWVVNTHWHGDHVYGNQAYLEAFPGVRFVGHAALPEALAGPASKMLADDRARLPDLVERRRRALATGEGPDGQPLTEEHKERLRYSLRVNERQISDLTELRLVPPDVEVADERVLEVGGRSVRLVAFDRAHTGTDVAVHLPEAGIVAAGDLVEEGLPWIGEEADPAGWARALDRVAALDARVLLPAHGGVQRDGRLLDGQRTLFRALSRRVATAVEEGRSLEPTKAAVDLSDVRPGYVGEGDRADRAWSRWVETAVERTWSRARPER